MFQTFKITREKIMKYFFAFLLISSVQILFMIAFTLCAIGIGVTALAGKLKSKKI